MQKVPMNRRISLTKRAATNNQVQMSPQTIPRSLASRFSSEYLTQVPVTFLGTPQTLKPCVIFAVVWLHGTRAAAVILYLTFQQHQTPKGEKDHFR